MSETNTQDEQDTSSPRIVSALLWEAAFGKPFSIADKIAKENPLAEIKEKTRGRPRKYNLPVIEGKTIHKMSDEEEALRKLLPESIKKMIQDYREYVEEGKSPKDALETVSKLYNVPYCQAFNICADEI